MKLKDLFKKEELIAEMDPIYRIYMKEGDGWYVVNMMTGVTHHFSFKFYNSYLTVLNFAEKLC